MRASCRRPAIDIVYVIVAHVEHPSPPVDFTPPKAGFCRRQGGWVEEPRQAGRSNNNGPPPPLGKIKISPSHAAGRWSDLSRVSPAQQRLGSSASQRPPPACRRPAPECSCLPAEVLFRGARCPFPELITATPPFRVAFARYSAGRPLCTDSARVGGECFGGVMMSLWGHVDSRPRGSACGAVTPAEYATVARNDQTVWLLFWGNVLWLLAFSARGCPRTVLLAGGEVLRGRRCELIARAQTKSSGGEYRVSLYFRYIFVRIIC